MTPVVSIVIAVTENRVIGAGGDMPWRLPSDLKRFRALTMGKPIVMGRKTHESIGRALDGRDNIVVTRQSDYAPEGVRVVSSVEEALELGRALARKSGADEVVVIGGGEIYNQALPATQRIYLTEIHADIAGDTSFPELDPRVWREVHRERVPRDERDSADTSFVIFESGTPP